MSYKGPIYIGEKALDRDNLPPLLNHLAWNLERSGKHTFSEVVFSPESRIASYHDHADPLELQGRQVMGKSLSLSRDPGKHLDMVYLQFAGIDVDPKYAGMNIPEEIGSLQHRIIFAEIFGICLNWSNNPKYDGILFAVSRVQTLNKVAYQLTGKDNPMFEGLADRDTPEFQDPRPFINALVRAYETRRRTHGN